MRAFPKIFALGTDYIKDIFKEPVEITEKIDGSQFAFGLIRGEIFMRSKGKQIYPDNPEKMFSIAVDYVMSIAEKLPENFLFYCEYLRSRKHNTLAYDRVPANNLMLFGVMDMTERFTSDYPSLKDYAKWLGIEVVPCLLQGEMIDPLNLIDEIMGRQSVLGGCEIEGIVVKNYERKFLLGGQPMPLMAGKFVSEKFKETNHDRWDKEEKSKGRFALFCEGFRTEARWEKAIQHLSERGEIENEPRDIGKLLKEINIDIDAEEKENIKEWLYKEYHKDILRSSTKGFPEWYKKRLLEQSLRKGEHEETKETE